MASRWIDEPLVRFFAIGAIVFAIDYARRPAEEAHEIEITPAFTAAIARREESRTGEAPNEEAIESAIARFVREEALYREALALGLDQGDLIVRRRLVQKMELWLDARAEEHEPTERELLEWHRAHEAELRAPGRTAIDIVFFTDHDRAVAARASIADVDPATLGDPFPHGRTLGPRTDAQLDALLGDGVSAALAQIAIGAWSPPIEARGGTLILRPTQRIEGHTPSLDEVRDRARREMVEARRERDRARAVDAIVARWRVVRSDRR